MKHVLKFFIAIAFPWLTLLLNDNPGGAVVALIMQATIVGWPFASAWALRVDRESRQKIEAAKKESK